MTTCTLVWEYNYPNTDASQDDCASVWIYNGDGTSDLARSGPGWTKVAGPLHQDAASSIHAALKAFFLQSGVKVIDEGIAD